ncbi:hypothetical protein B0A48_08077 [Cryoendolithus antarcticus]|uniref:Uncharacterized protein n=1 Tax=Cryoendolithus antarcticus TaxID=1507870 RepID=A0A1V8T0X4_9PEZI|nr:hypothetical protein B0A48_08077 [Cryoendolithus antarcticus]
MAADSYTALPRPRTPRMDDKPLPSLPSKSSPTLTNPDMVLPDGLSYGDSSPDGSYRRPPSLGYLRDITNMDAGMRASVESERSNVGSRDMQREKRGLMSRKLMLLRSRSGETGDLPVVPRSVPHLEEDGEARKTDGTMLVVPGFEDSIDGAEDAGEGKRMSIGSSFDMEDYNAIPAFLAKYKDSHPTDDENTDSESIAAHPRATNGLDAHRQAQKDEQVSAMLSKRAEEILANAKKRLNLMEGNLRGARDLVAPLTAANLKRATSLGSSPANGYSARRFEAEQNRPGSPARQHRTLHAQASSPTMGRDFHLGHMRVHSENEVPERPRTAMESASGFTKGSRYPVRPNGRTANRALRGSQSFDSLSSVSTPRRPTRVPVTPDLNLGPLPEDEDAVSPISSRDDSGYSLTYSDDPTRSISATDDLREQMTSLKGRISNLRDRAKKDSMRRQSMNSLRDVSPLNNAQHEAPGMYYFDQSSAQHAALNSPTAVDDTAGHYRATNLPTPPQENHYPFTGSRNAFAERTPGSQSFSRPTSRGPRNAGLGILTKDVKPMHKRTKSGTAIVSPAEHRYSHHQEQNGHRDMPGSFDFHDNDVTPDADQGAEIDPYDDVILPPPSPDEGAAYGEGPELELDNESIYEDADDLPTSVVAHEDREDAFDYEHFFLHSAMATYQRSSSPAASDISNTSAETARAPAHQVADEKELSDDEELADDTEIWHSPESDDYPPAMPETPEALRQIERKIQHSRTLSADSVSTVASFATATEGFRSGRASALDWPIPPSVENSRPSTAVRKVTKEGDATSDRADSGVEVPRRPASSGSQGPRSALSPTMGFSFPINGAMSPPLTPMTRVPDPTAVAVNALLDPSGRVLGLKDKAMMFGLTEGLRRAVSALQGGDEGVEKMVELRRRLEEARRLLEGI